MAFSVVAVAPVAFPSSEIGLKMCCNCFGLNFYFSVFFKFHSSINTNSVMVVKPDVTEKTVFVSRRDAILYMTVCMETCPCFVYVCVLLPMSVIVHVSLFDVFKCSLHVCVYTLVFLHITFVLCICQRNIDIYVSVCS